MCRIVFLLLGITAASGSPADVTLRGTVQDVMAWGNSARWLGPHLTLSTATGPVEVHFGPVLHLGVRPYQPIQGQSIAVTGSWVRYRGKDALFAREVIADGRIFTLRHRQDAPAWRRNRPAK